MCHMWNSLPRSANRHLLLFHFFPCPPLIPNQIQEAKTRAPLCCTAADACELILCRKIQKFLEKFSISNFRIIYFSLSFALVFSNINLRWLWIEFIKYSATNLTLLRYQFYSVKYLHTITGVSQDMFVKLYFDKVLTKSSVVLVRSFFSPLVNSRIHFSQCSCRHNEKKLDDETVRLLETLSLVKFESKEHIRVVEDAINFASKIESVNTDNVEPLISVLEHE